MSDYEPKPQDLKWLKQFNAHLAAAGMAELDLIQDPRKAMLAAHCARSASLQLHVRPAVALYRNGECVASWAVIR